MSPPATPCDPLGGLTRDSDRALQGREPPAEGGRPATAEGPEGRPVGSPGGGVEGGGRVRRKLPYGAGGTPGQADPGGGDPVLWKPPLACSAQPGRERAALGLEEEDTAALRGGQPSQHGYKPRSDPSAST